MSKTNRQAIKFKSATGSYRTLQWYTLRYVLCKAILVQL
uniref:Uncharacterized protein n=1 Tax=Anguilla anguilla TaxID=7936 RepID=A0A0E9SXW4_ANGAN